MTSYADDFELAQALWFRGGAEIDDELRRQFAALVEAAARGELDAWRASPRGCLGLVILLDQFPRNIYRGTAQAFRHDAAALAIAKEAIDRGFERDLAPAESLFLHLCLVHAEDLAEVRRGLDGITELITRCARRQQKTARSWRVGALKGTLTPDGRLDLCKQVVGPDGIRPLLGAMMASHQIKRLLLGNNIVGDGGAAAIAAFIRDRTDSPLECWYIAGNQIGPAGIQHVCDALAHDTQVTSLWLERNPLKPAGMRPLADLLRTNRTIEVLDLVNCGLLDDGLATLLGALMGPGANRTLKHLYLGTTGVTERSAPLVADFLAGDCRLESLYVMDIYSVYRTKT